MHFEVLSDRPCLIDAIGELQPGKAMQVSDEQLDLFYALHGVNLKGSNLPAHVQVTCVMDLPEVEETSEPIPNLEPIAEEG